MPRERPIVDDSLCFVCQEVPPTNIISSSRKKESFKMCDVCTDILVSMNQAENDIRRNLSHSDRLKIFTYTLGADLSSVELRIERIFHL